MFKKLRRRNDVLFRWSAGILPAGLVKITKPADWKSALQRSLFWLAILLLPCSTFASSVIHDLHQQDPLNERWKRAFTQAKNQGWNDYWIGYSIQKMMGENEYICTGIHLHGRIQVGRKNVPLGELISGMKIRKPLHPEKAEETVKNEAVRTLNDLEHPGKNIERKVLKELAILAHFASGIKELEILNVELAFDFEGKPLLWLGPGQDSESIPQLQHYYKQSHSTDVKENIVFAIAAHQNVALASPFLQQVLNSRDPDSIRSEAVAGIAAQNNEQALQILLKTVRTEPSTEVREEALDGVAEMSIPTARKALMDLAQHFEDQELRMEAVSLLSNREEEVALLKRLVFEDPDEEIREEALDVLLELKAIPFLIRVAKSHPNTETRTSAIDLLGESRDPTARQALIEIAQDP